MNQKKSQNARQYDMSNHGINNLYSEWPTPSDVVAGFGGNTEQAAHKQWIRKPVRPAK
jgi:hypothetical protein